MQASAESPQRRVSPPAKSTAPHSRTPSKTTVTSANVASVGETNLATSANTAATSDRPLLPQGSTPRARRPSFIDQQAPPQQLPTPRGSLQWPSTHRSFSSAAATRDSSCHSQMTDRANTSGLHASTATGLRGRAASSTCHTPMSSRGEMSDHRSSAFSGAGGRPGHSIGPHPTAPPLVDVGDTLSQGPQSASHSVYTTGLCTPRDVTTSGMTHGGVRHPSPFTTVGGCGGGHPSNSSISATVNVGARSTATPAPPPLDDFAAEAQTLPREVLEERVAQMRGENLVLRTSVLRLREALATLQEGLRANYVDIERRQDSIANTLLRRLEATKRHRTKLVAHLRAVELEKASQEVKLQSTKQSISELSKHLKREEHEIAERLQGRLAKLHVQREQLDRALVEQTSSLQQLGQLVQEVEEMGLGDGVDSTAAAAPAVSLSAAEAPVNSSASVSAGLQAVAATPSFLPQVGGGVHERSSSRVSVASSTTGGANTTISTTATTADVAYDPNAMLRYLEEEIASAEGLRSEALHRAEEYAATRERLERRLTREKQRKAEQASRTEALRQELRSASTAVNEMAASQETAMEMEVDRQLNGSRVGGTGFDTVSSASSACVTPKMRATSAMVSRGASVSPGAVVGGIPAGGDGRPLGAADAFLLPSSSLSSGAPVSLGVHADPTTAAATAGAGAAAAPLHSAATPHVATGMVVGDSSVVPRMSSSSMRINTSISRDETTASSEGTPHTTRLLVQDTSRMAAPRLVMSAESTPRRTPLATPQTSMCHEPAA